MCVWVEGANAYRGARLEDGGGKVLEIMSWRGRRYGWVIKRFIITRNLMRSERERERERYEREVDGRVMGEIVQGWL